MFRNIGAFELFMIIDFSKNLFLIGTINEGIKEVEVELFNGVE
jgi:hypothetical protein